MAKTLFNISDKIVAGDTAGEALAYRDRIIADGGTLETFAETEAEIRRLQSLGLYDSLSLGYVAGGYKTSKWYNIKGATGDLAVTRATNGTRQNRAGLINTLGNNLTRADFDGGVLKGNLVESAATNGFPSYPLSAGGFTSIVANNELSASNFMFTHTENTANLVRERSGGLASSSTPYVISTVYKNVPSNRYVKLLGSRNAAGGSFAGATFDHLGNIVEQSIANTAKVTNLGKGYFLAEVVVTPTVTGTRTAFTRVTDTALTGPTSGAIFVGTGETYIIGAHQVELGTSASSRIFVSGVTALRNADNISKTGIASEIGQTEGVIYAEVNVRRLGLVSGVILRLTDGASGTGRISIEKNSSIANNILFTNWGGVNVSIEIPESGKLRLANKYGATTKLFANGVNVGSTTFTAPAPLSKISIGSDQSGSTLLNDRIYSVYHWKTAKTDAELIALTTL